MNQRVTTAIVLSRIDYGEADRILTVLTPDQGKLRLMAKGVRRLKSKLAGGVELFSTTDLTYLPGRSGIGTLISSRLRHHYKHIVQHIDRTMLGYDCIKVLNKATEDEPEPEYYQLLEQSFAALDDETIPLEIVQVWFAGQLLRYGGHTPNLRTGSDGARLTADARYEFSFDDIAFTARPDGSFTADDIKFLRLVFAGTVPAVLARIEGAAGIAERTRQLVTALRQQYIRT